MLTRDRVFEVLQTIPDPEMPISIVELGLVEHVSISPVPPRERPAVRAREELGAACPPEMPSPQPSVGGSGSIVTIDLLPTFIGCPALEMIAGDVRAKVGALPGVGDVLVNWRFDPPWTVDRISVAGRESLRVHGVSVPEHGSHLHVAGHESPQSVTLRTSAVPCPFCGSRSTYLDSPFGPTRCRMIYYCEACRNSFEHLKRV